MKKALLGIAIAAVTMMGVVQAVSADALDDIKKSGKIRIAVDLGVPPYGMTDDKMQPTGSDIETAKALAKDWGLEFEHVPTTGASRIPALQTGKADLVISTLSVTPERAKVIDFSKGYAVLRTVIAAPKNVPLKSMADLDGKTVGTVRGTTHDTQRQVEVKFVLDTFNLAVGVKKDETRLVEEVNKWIATNLKNGRLDAIYKKYHGNGLPASILNQ